MISQDAQTNLLNAVRELTESGQADYLLTAFSGPIKIPNSQEEAVLASIEEGGEVDAALIEALRKDLGMNGGYCLEGFAIRMAIWSARLGNPSPLRKGLWALFAGGDRVDQRDILRALSIVADCAGRCGFEFSDAVQKSLCWVSENSLRSLRAALSHDSNAARLQSMGFQAMVLENGELNYVNWP